MFNYLWPHRLCSPWDSPGQYTGVGSLSLLQVFFPTQGSNPGLPHCRRILYQLSHKESPRILEWVSLLQWIFPLQELNWGLLYCRRILYQLSHQESPAGDPGSIHGLGRSPEKGNGNPLHYSYLENIMGRGSLQAAVHEAAIVWHNLATKPPPPRIGIAASYNDSICSFFFFFFFKKFPTVFHCGLTNLHFHQQYRSVPFSPHPIQHLLFADN